VEFDQVVRQRRMVRNYSPEPVPAEQLNRILRTARRAPSAGFAQGQSFVVVTDEAVRSKIGEIGDQSSYLKKGMPPWISRAPVHVILCTSPAAYGERYAEPDKAGTAGAAEEWPAPWWFIDAGCSFILLLLAAVNEGLAAGFLAFRRESISLVRELLLIPQDVIPIGVVTIGKPIRDRPSGSLTRGWKPEHEVVHRETWGGLAP